jgi:hypothetical protein
MDCRARAAACAWRADRASRSSATAAGLTGAHHPAAAATSASQAAAGLSLDDEQRSRNEESHDEARNRAHAAPQYKHIDEPASYPHNHVQR